MSESEAMKAVNQAFDRLKVLEDAYRRHFPEGRLGPPRRCTDPDCDGDDGHDGPHFLWTSDEG